MVVHTRNKALLPSISAHTTDAGSQSAQSINDLSQAHGLAICTHGVFKKHPESQEQFILHATKGCLSPLERNRKSLGSQFPVVEGSLCH